MRVTSVAIISILILIGVTIMFIHYHEQAHVKVCESVGGSAKVTWLNGEGDAETRCDLPKNADIDTYRQQNLYIETFGYHLFVLIYAIIGSAAIIGTAIAGNENTVKWRS